MTTNVSIHDSINKLKKRCYGYKQQPEHGNETHLRKFNSNSDVIEYYKGNLYYDESLIEYEKAQDSITGKTHTDVEIKEIFKEKIKGIALIKRSDMSRYGPLMTNIRDQYG